MEADREAKGRDRRRATKKVEEALARGRIVAADADLRLMQIESATMVSDLDRLVRDLAPAPNSGVPAPPATSRPPSDTSGPVFAPGPVWQPPSAGPGEDGRPVGPLMKPRRKRKASPVAIAVVGAALVASFVSRGGDDSGSVEEVTSVGSRELLTEWGFRELVDTLQADTGSATVLDLTLHPTYADVVLALEPGGRTGRTFRYDTSGLYPVDATKVRGRPVDLLDLEPRAVTVAVREAEALLGEAPAGTYVELLSGRRPGLRAVSGDGSGGTAIIETTTTGRVVSAKGP